MIGGIVAAALMSAYTPTIAKNLVITKTTEMTRVNDAIILFSKRNHRLPCVDTVGEGLENCSPVQVSGGVPYITLGLAPKTVVGEGAGADLIYAVYRNTPDADLATLIERTGDSPADNNYLNVDDFRSALISAASASLNTSYLTVTGDGWSASSSSSFCVDNAVSNVAFALISGGGFDMDMDPNNSIFDGPHNTVTWPWPAGNDVKCFASPLMRSSSIYDDTVLVTTFVQLISYLKQY